MDAASPLSDHAARVAAALAAIDKAAETEARLVHEAQRIATEITHHRARTASLRTQLQLVLSEAGAAAGLT